MAASESTHHHPTLPNTLHRDRQRDGLSGNEKKWKTSPVPMTGGPDPLSSPTHHPMTHQQVPLGLSLQALQPSLPTDSARAHVSQNNPVWG